MKNIVHKLIVFLIIALLAIYVINRIARLMRWIAPMALEVVILCIAVVVIVWLVAGKKK